MYETTVTQDDTVMNIREEKELPLSEFLSYYNTGHFDKLIIVDDTRLEGYEFIGEGQKKSFMATRKTIKEENYNLYYSFKPLMTPVGELGIQMTWTSPIVGVEFTEKSTLQKVLEQVGPILLFLIVLIIFAKFALPKSGGLPFSMKVGKQTTKTHQSTKFSDVAWMEEVKMELSEIVDYLKNPEKYNRVGARHPKWVLLFGQPGSGKTLLARAVAGESDVPFFSASWSEFMEMLVGMGAAKVRELFNKAKTAGKAIVFIDEIDAIGKKRGSWYTGWHQEQEQTLNQILTEMDGFDKTANIIVIAATNRPDVLDPALLRAGRFDRKVNVGRPTYEERVLIFECYFKGKKIWPDVDVESLAKRTSGLVGADIENIVNEAALKVAKDNRLMLEGADFEYALEKVIMGPEKKIKSIKEHEKNIIAFHELWHAVTAYLLENTDPVEKISIVSRGQALGVTWMIPKEDRYLYSKSKFLDEVVSLLGWRAAEEVYFGKNEITTGASNDFERATGIIRDMVIKYWMDEELWPVLYFDKDKEGYPMYKPYSEKTAELIDSKIKDYLFAAYDKAKKLIEKNKELISQMSTVLLEKEYLNKADFLLLMQEPGSAKGMLEAVLEHKKKLALQVEKIKKATAKNMASKNKKGKKNETNEQSKKSIKNEHIARVKWALDKFLG